MVAYSQDIILELIFLQRVVHISGHARTVDTRLGGEFLHEDAAREVALHDSERPCHAVVAHILIGSLIDAVDYYSHLTLAISNLGDTERKCYLEVPRNVIWNLTVHMHRTPALSIYF